MKEVPKILADTPNIYQLNSNEMNDILKPTENKINQRKRMYSDKYIDNLQGNAITFEVYHFYTFNFVDYI